VRPLPPQDAAWLLIESPERPMNVGGLTLLEPPADAGPTWVREQIVEPALEHTEVRPPLNRRLRHPHGRMGIFEWEETEVDLTFHVRHLALPAPGRVRELLVLISQLHSPLLDRHRPLWELYVIEGLADGRAAVYAKFHHSLMDGMAAFRQMLAPLSRSPDDRDLPPPWAVERGHREAEDRPVDPLSRLSRLAAGATRTAGGALTQARGAARVAQAFTDQLAASLRSQAEVMPFQAPPSMLNVPLTAARRFVAQSYDFARFRSVARAAGVTVNDVVLAVCGGSLRAYLESHDELPERPLIALVPADIRDPDAGPHEGNALSLLLANLGTHVADPLARLELVHQSMAAGKQRLRAMSPAARQSYGLALAAPLVASQLTGAVTRMRPMYNVIVSNLPGPSEPLYLNGAQLSGIYPVALVADGLALNISQTSYAGQMEFGLLADRDALPGMQRLIDYVEDALAALEKAVGA
jgi:diacylglycerol O-acyltransferase